MSTRNPLPWYRRRAPDWAVLLLGVALGGAVLLAILSAVNAHRQKAAEDREVERARGGR